MSFKLFSTSLGLNQILPLPISVFLVINSSKNTSALVSTECWCWVCDTLTQASDENYPLRRWREGWAGRNGVSTSGPGSGSGVSVSGTGRALLAMAWSGTVLWSC